MDVRRCAYFAYYLITIALLYYMDTDGPAVVLLFSYKHPSILAARHPKLKAVVNEDIVIFRGSAEVRCPLILDLYKKW